MITTKMLFNIIYFRALFLNFVCSNVYWQFLQVDVIAVKGITLLQLLAQHISLFATPKYSTLYKSNLLSSGCQFSFSLPLQGSTLGTILHIFCTDAHEQQK